MQAFYINSYLLAGAILPYRNLLGSNSEKYGVKNLVSQK
jgi:hypothetical protein